MTATRIEAELLIPGDGEPVPDATLVLDGEAIRYAGPTAAAPATEGAETVRAPVVMPGLWDCHVHLFGLPPGTGVDAVRVLAEPTAARGARCVGDLRAALDAGVTSVREVGGLGVDLAKAVADGSVEGPAIYAAGAVLSITGGHGDAHDLPLPWVLDAGHRGADLRQCDGPVECARAAREQLRRGARLIKLCASGGVVSILDDPHHQQFTLDEMRAIVEVAGMAERVVAAHCHGKPGIMAAVEAGVATVEHGTYLDEEAADAMRETGTILVATRTIIEDLLVAPGLPPHITAKIRQIADRHADAVRLAHERGVTIAAGTDIALSRLDPHVTWGTNGREPGLLARLGLSPAEAIRAVTADAPGTLGPQAPRSGVLAEGYDADVITLDADPLADPSVLGDPAHVTGVWQRAARVHFSGS